MLLLLLLSWWILLLLSRQILELHPRQKRLLLHSRLLLLQSWLLRILRQLLLLRLLVPHQAKCLLPIWQRRHHEHRRRRLRCRERLCSVAHLSAACASCKHWLEELRLRLLRCATPQAKVGVIVPNTSCGRHGRCCHKAQLKPHCAVP